MKLGASSGPAASRGAVASSTLAAMSLGLASRGGADHRAKRRSMTEVVNLFLLAAAWGFGASLATPESKLELSELLTARANAHPTVMELLADGHSVAKSGMSLHDNYLDPQTGSWQRW